MILYEFVVMMVCVCGVEAVLFAPVVDKPQLSILGGSMMAVAWFLELMILW